MAKDKNGNKPSYLTVRDIAQDLQIQEQTIRLWIRKGELPAVAFAGTYRISRVDYQEFLKKHRKQPPDQESD